MARQIMLEGSSSWKLQPCKLQATNYSTVDLSIGQSSADPKNKDIMDWQQNDLGKAPMETDATSEPEEEDYYNEDDLMYDEDDVVSESYSEYDTSEIDYDKFVAAQFDGLDLPPGVEAAFPGLPGSGEPEPDQPVLTRPKNEVDHVIEKKFRAFKQFDTVPDFPDHYFLAKNYSAGKKPSKEWLKKVQQDWKLLEKDLPDTIMVRACEDRMDLLRAAIVGPDGTPYHNGLFFFDIQFPADYPHSPPLAHYHSGGLRINPNLYECGKVCLSLLNTWTGHGCEKWSKNSTMLQVLVSIQALVLNEKPYFNEPGYPQSANTPSGERASLYYSETVFLYSCKTMLYSLRKPPKHFEDYVAGHFREHGGTILRACKYYMDGVMVGSQIPTEKEEEEMKKQKKEAQDQMEEDEDENKKPKAPIVGPYSFVASNQFKRGLASLFEELLMEFTVKAADTDSILAERLKLKQSGSSSSSSSSLK
ncbi:hypothetical protein LUZ60_010012 [Juncus effusus]|nr:hypothetical protein LUZ60_010012 [Juncus effusus]